MIIDHSLIGPRDAAEFTVLRQSLRELAPNHARAAQNEHLHDVSFLSSR